MSARTSLFKLCCCFVLVTGLWQTGGAATFTVTSTEDAGAGSLREAVSSANTNSGPDVIDFDLAAFPSGFTTQITLASTLQLTDTSGGTTIEGDGRVHLTAESKTFNCIEVRSNGNVIRGLQITGFWGGIILERHYATHDNVIGGSSPGQRNVISDNEHVGVAIDGPQSSGNIVIGNYIGVDAAGTAAFGAQAVGVDIAHGAYSNIVGGATPEERNVVSGNTFVGVSILDTTLEGTTDNHVQGNYIGTDRTGMVAIPNNQGGVGIGFDATGNFIGGSTPGTGNVISGHTGLTPHGIRLGTLGDGNFIYGNIIGLTADGSMPLPNGIGIQMEYGTNDNRIGGLEPNEANIISGNTGYGIGVGGESQNNVVEGNYIGTDPSGNVFGNGQGIRMGASAETTAVANQIGPANYIWFNTDYGVLLDAATTFHNVVTENSITANGGVNPGRGIVLANGANEGILPPVITTVTETEVTGTAGVPDGSIVEIFRDEGDQGETYVGSTTVASGLFAFTGASPVSGGNLTATVTDTVGNTSEFSVPVPNYLVATNLEIKGFKVTKKVSLTRGKGIVSLSITIENTSAGEHPGLLTITGEQNGVVFIHQMSEVFDPVGNGSTKYTLDPFEPAERGDILWTATLQDDDPDVDEAQATTVVR